MSDKRVYTPAEFAALFGRTKTWTYRLHYAGKIKCITDYGKLMVPASEAARIEADAGSHRSRKELAKEPSVETIESAKKPTKGSERWSAWVKGEKTGKKSPKQVSISGVLRRKSPGTVADNRPPP